LPPVPAGCDVLPAQIQGRWFHLYLLLDLYIRRQAKTLDGKGLEHLVSELRQFAPAPVVLQETGFQVTLAAALASLGLPARHRQSTSDP
jgi:hypothetical protein